MDVRAMARRRGSGNGEVTKSTACSWSLPRHGALPSMRAQSIRQRQFSIAAFGRAECRSRREGAKARSEETAGR
eukprot:8925362-Pyramimonas_sp.AAC.1